MPSQPNWMVRLSEVRRSLELEKDRWIEREQVQVAFDVSRRQARNILHRFGANTENGRLRVRRDILLLKLDDLDSSPEAEEQRTRKREFALRLREAKAPKVIVPEKILHTWVEDLPKEVHLEVGKLTVSFDTAEDLVRKLFAFSRACVNDWNAVEKYEKREAAVSKGVAG